MAMVFCPLCKSVHDMDFKQREENIVLGGKKITLIREIIHCQKLDLETSNIKLKNKDKEEDVKIALMKEIWPSLEKRSKLILLDSFNASLEEKENADE